MADVEIREATLDDKAGVKAIADTVWTDRGGDYLGDVYERWVQNDDTFRTIVAEVDDTVVGVTQGVLLTDHEAFCQGMRTHPDYRGLGVSRRLTRDLFEWQRANGIRVSRNMVFGFNGAGLAASRAAGFDPGTEFRWLRPTTIDGSLSRVTGDVDAAWSYWLRCGARDHLKGLAMDRNESWAVSELTREDLVLADDEDALFVVEDGGVSGFSYRAGVRTYDDTDRVVYGVAAWEDLDAARAIVDATARDADRLGADDFRVLVPETVRLVSDAARTGAQIADEPHFVMAADLTADE